MFNKSSNFYGTGYQIYSFLVLVSCDAISASQETGKLSLIEIHIIYSYLLP